MLVDATLDSMDAEFSAMYAKTGSPSIAQAPTAYEGKWSIKRIHAAA